MSDPITWLSGVTRFDANPTATVAVDRARWESLGATFVEVDDGDDETPGLAVGQVDGLDFGVLDYGEGETYLLIAEPDAAAREHTLAVLGALEGAGVLAVDEEVVDVAGAQRSIDAPQVVDRLARLESRIAMLEAAAGEAGAEVVAKKLRYFPALATGLYAEALREQQHARVRAGQLGFWSQREAIAEVRHGLIVDTAIGITAAGIAVGPRDEDEPSGSPEDPSPQSLA
jgi:hypothetical protein